MKRSSLLGPALIVLAPFVGAIPGPGGVVVLIAGIALTLQSSQMAKRFYPQEKALAAPGPLVGQGAAAAESFLPPAPGA